MSSINGIAFCGGETAGSTAYANSVVRAQNGNTNFRGNYVNSVSDTQNKKSHIPAIIIGTGISAAAAIVGMAYAHKNNAIEKLSDGKIKDIAKKLEPAGEKCHHWCSQIKTKCEELWGKIGGKK
jgi:hypothetical protein